MALCSFTRHTHTHTHTPRMCSRPSPILGVHGFVTQSFTAEAQKSGLVTGQGGDVLVSRAPKRNSPAQGSGRLSERGDCETEV